MIATSDILDACIAAHPYKGWKLDASKRNVILVQHGEVVGVIGYKYDWPSSGILIYLEPKARDQKFAWAICLECARRQIPVGNAWEWCPDRAALLDFVSALLPGVKWHVTPRENSVKSHDEEMAVTRMAEDRGFLVSHYVDCRVMRQDPREAVKVLADRLRAAVALLDQALENPAAPKEQGEDRP